MGVKRPSIRYWKRVQLLARGKVGEGANWALARIQVTFLKWAPMAILETLTHFGFE